MIYSPGKSMGFQWDKDTLAKAQEMIAQDKNLSTSLETLGQAPKKTTGQPDRMAGMEERSLRPPKAPKYPVRIIERVDDTKERIIDKTHTEHLPGQKTPVMVPMEGNPNIPNDYKDLPTPPPPEAFENTPPKPASHPLMYEVPQQKPPKPKNPVQIGMKPPTPPQQI